VSNPFLTPPAGPFDGPDGTQLLYDRRERVQDSTGPYTARPLNKEKGQAREGEVRACPQEQGKEIDWISCSTPSARHVAERQRSHRSRDFRRMVEVVRQDARTGANRAG